MTPECISLWAMLGTWAGALATFLAVVTALWLPKKQLQREEKEAEKNAQKLVRAQLNIVRDRLCSHVDALNIPLILDSSVINVSFLPHEVLSAIDIVKLTSLYKLMHDIDLAEESRKKAHALLTSQDDPEFKNHVNAYKDWIKTLNTNIDSLIAAF